MARTCKRLGGMGNLFLITYGGGFGTILRGVPFFLIGVHFSWTVYFIMLELGKWLGTLLPFLQFVLLFINIAGIPVIMTKYPVWRLGVVSGKVLTVTKISLRI